MNGAPDRKQRLIHHFLEESARIYPNKIALTHEGNSATYSEINNKSNKLARWLMDAGINRGDRVLLQLENCLEYVASYYAVLKSGAIVVPVAGQTKPEVMRHYLAELEPRVLISSSRLGSNLKLIDLSSFSPGALILKGDSLSWAGAGFPVYCWEELTQGPETANPDLPIEDYRPASIIYTSGSGGKPKGVLLSHSNIVSNTLAICRSLKLSENDIQMVVLPFFYVMGKSLLNTHFAVGGKVVINNKFMFTASVVKEMADEQVTGFSGVPSTYAILLQRSPLADFRDKLASLRYVSQAGGHMPRKIKEELRRTLPSHTDIYVMYGATEASARLTCLEPDRFWDKMDSIGKPIPFVTLRVLDNQGNEVPTGEKGELVAAGPNVMMGYWKNPEASAEVLSEKGYRTGDLGYCDPEGFYYVVGRKDNLRKGGGHRISPQEIEDVLMSTNFFLEVAVLGIPDDLLGQKIVTLASPKNGSTHSDIISFCARKLPRYKLPAEIRLVASLPKTGSGKVDLARCLDMVK